jgi:hypothetical protein
VFDVLVHEQIKRSGPDPCGREPGQVIHSERKKGGRSSLEIAILDIERFFFGHWQLVAVSRRNPIVAERMNSLYNEPLPPSIQYASRVFR